MPTSIEQLAARLAMPDTQNPENPAQPGTGPNPANDPANPADSQPRYYTKVKIVSNAKGESILFGFDKRTSGNYGLTIWLPAAEAGKWTVYEPQFNGLPYVKDFDLISNHLQGRKDDTLDLTIIAYSDDRNSQLLYFPALPFSTQVEDWDDYLAKPIVLKAPQWGVTLDMVYLGLLPKARRSVFLLSSTFDSERGMFKLGASRYDVDVSGPFAEYPFDLAPGLTYTLNFPVFQPCVAARQPESFTFDDGLVGAYTQDSNTGVVKVMLPKAPLGDAWELTPLGPLPSVGPYWLPVSGISTFRRPDTGEPIITYVMGTRSGSPLNKAVWVMDNDTLYHSNRGCWWLAAPPDQLFPPPSRVPVRALPVEMQAGQSPTWVWLQLGDRREDDFIGVIASRSAEFFNEGASNEWLAKPASYFEASLAASPTVPGETIARVFMVANKHLGYETLSLTVATLDNASGQWQYQDLPVPPPAGR